MILDKLLEKKQLIIFLKLRKGELLKEKRLIIKRENPRELEKIKLIDGRIREVDHLRIFLEQNNNHTIKNHCKSLWKDYGDKL